MLVETHNRKLRIVLTGTEVDNLFGGYDGIDYNDPNARHILHELINRAFGRADFLKNTDRLTIEVHPHGGGCTIDLSKHIKQPKRLYPTGKYALKFSDSEELISGAVHIAEIIPESTAKSSLYKMPRGYALLLTLTHRRLRQLRCQYDIITDPNAVASIEEYQPMICRSDTVEKISRAFG